MNQSERLNRIEQLLRSRRWVRTKTFLEELEVSPSTFKRDIAFLRDRLRTPIVWDSQRQAYALEQDPAEPVTNFPGLWLTTREIHAFLVLDRLIESLQPDFLGPHLQPLKKRVVNFAKLEKPVEILLRHVRIFRLGGRKIDSFLLEKVAQALIDRLRLQITYNSRSKNENRAREISPQRLVYYRDNWYLDAWCHLREKVRSFSLDRIESARILKTPANDIPEPELDQELASGYGIFSGAKVNTAILRFNAHRARWIASEVWHSQQKSYQHDDYYYLELPYSDDRELILDILRYGSDVEVLEPIELRQKVQDALRQALKRYEE